MTGLKSYKNEGLYGKKMAGFGLYGHLPFLMHYCYIFYNFGKGLKGKGD
jgi:hypothetical protein